MISNEGSDSDSGEKETCGKFPTFCMPKSMAEYEWDVRTYFVNKEEFMETIRTYGLQSRRNLKFEKNDKKRVRVKCLGARGKCVCIAYCAYVPILKTRQLRKIVDKHTCLTTPQTRDNILTGLHKSNETKGKENLLNLEPIQHLGFHYS